MKSKDEKNRPPLEDIRQMVRKADKDKLPDISRLSNENLHFLIHELEVFQIELINRNEDLHKAYQDLERTRDRLQNLYDTMPVGYCTLSDRGMILECNQPFCTMVGEDRNNLLGSLLASYLTLGSRDHLYQHLDQVRQSGQKCTGILELLPSGSGRRFIQMESMACKGPSESTLFSIACSDITDWKMVEEENTRLLRPQSALNRLLSLSLEDVSLEEALHEFLRHIISLPWLGLEAAGAVYLLDGGRNILERKAQIGIPQKIVEDCREIRLGQCHCGRAAAEGKLIYAAVPENVWSEDPTIPSEHHYLYSIPIGSPAASPLGVYIIYLKGDERDEIVEDTLLAAARVIAGVVEHKKTALQLRKAHDHLEERVQERTAELEEKNIALKVLLEQRAKDKKDMEYRMVTNVKKIILPYLEKLQKSRMDQEQTQLLHLIKTQLENITSSLAPSLSSKYLGMTPSEIRICHLISQGHNSKEIASLLDLSPETVNKHRQNIRKKCGLNHKKINLASYLATLNGNDDSSQ